MDRPSWIPWLLAAGALGLVGAVVWFARQEGGVRPALDGRLYETVTLDGVSKSALRGGYQMEV